MRVGYMIRCVITLALGVTIGAITATVAALIYILNAHGDANE